MEPSLLARFYHCTCVKSASSRSKFYGEGSAFSVHELLKKWRASVDAAMPSVNPNYDPEKADQRLTGAQPKTDPI